MKLEQKTIRAIVWIAVAIALAIAAWLIIRKVRQGSDDRKKRKDYARLAAELENAGAAPAQLTSAQCENIADMVHDSVDSWGTDEEKLIKAIKSIPTAADYLNVKASYQSAYSANMWDDIDDDTDDDNYEYLTIVAHLNKIAVPENMR